MFHVIDDKFVILRSRGVYRQAKLYRYDGKLFAAYSGGFIRLCALFGDHGGTSAPNVSWLPGEHVRGGARGNPELV